MKKFTKSSLLLLFVFSTLPNKFFAASDNPWDSPEIDPPPTPIDTYLLLLILCAILLGGYFLFNYNLKKEKK
jgi:drug/metabolite transporter (DMT)-like permease